MYVWKAALPRWLNIEKAIHTGTNSWIVVSVNTDSCQLKNEDFSSQAFFQCEGKYPLQVHKMTSGWIMRKGASDAERSECCNTNRYLQVPAKAGFSLIDSVIFSRMLSHCDVPHKDMYFLFKCFEIIPTMMHSWCFSSAENFFFFDKCPLCRHTLTLQMKQQPATCPKSSAHFAEHACAALRSFGSMWSACCWVIPLALFSVRAIKGKPVTSPG